MIVETSIGRSPILRVILFWLSIAVLLVACGGDAQPRVLIIPTESPAAITPSHTPSPTLSPTVPRLPTITLAPTQTRAAETTSDTSPTALLRPTLTPAPATDTPTPRPTIEGVGIDYFTTTSQNVTPGDSVVLEWRITGAESARIFRLDSNGNRTNFWDIDAEGRLRVSTDSSELLSAQFLLRVSINGVEYEETVIIPTTCNIPWFFTPAPETCPLSPPITTAQVEQTFETGLMIWVGATQEIYVLYQDEGTPTWQVFPDNFTEGSPERDESLIPPPDRQQPIRGFGLVWRQNPEVSRRLGWAVTGESGYDGLTQTSTGQGEAEGSRYLRLQDNRVVVLRPGGSAWEVLAESVVAPVAPTPDLTATPAN